MSKQRVIFAGTSSFAVPALKALASSSEVILVLTQPQKPAGRGLKDKACAVDLAAQELGLPILRPESLKKSVFENIIAPFSCDFLIVASYGKIIPSWLLSWPKTMALNIHGSLLPRWRGASPIQQALLHGDGETGVGIMQMTAGLDEGPVFLEKKLAIELEDTQDSLAEKLGILGAQALIETLSNFSERQSVEQSGNVTYAPKITKEQGLINWDKPASEIINQFRAFTPWPGIYCFDGLGQRIKICSIALSPVSLTQGLPPGHAEIIAGKLVIHTGLHGIEVLALQWEGKKTLTVQEALKTKHPSLTSPLFFK